MKRLSAFMIITAGVFWGSMGVFVRWFDKAGYTSMQIAAMRVISAFLALCIFALVTGGTKAFRIKIRDIGWFAASGIFSIFGMTWSYFEAINRSSMCVSAILLYTAPFIVTVISCVFFGERFTIKKLVSLIVAFVGCVMVTGVEGRVSSAGVVFGLISGIAYALYSVFGKVLLKRYSPLTVTVYSFGFAAVLFLITGNIKGICESVLKAGTGYISLMAIVMGVVTAMIPFILYTYGLNGTDAGKASIMAYTEPLVASVCGYIFFDEFSGWFAVLGIMLIVFSVLLINNFGRKQHE